MCSDLYLYKVIYISIIRRSQSLHNFARMLQRSNQTYSTDFLRSLEHETLNRKNYLKNAISV